jgi:hypothetical protein
MSSVNFATIAAMPPSARGLMALSPCPEEAYQKIASRKGEMCDLSVTAFVTGGLGDSDERTSP